MRPMEAETGLSSSQVGARHHAGVDVRQEAGLGEDELAHAREVLERRLAAQLGQLLPRRSVAELRLVAEREEGFVAAGLRARSGHREHLVPVM